MGLDMWLTGKKFFWGEKDIKKEDKINALFPKIKYKIYRVEFSIMCWRKVNAIHNWFVENVQYGNDDCKSHYVSIEQLKELKSVIDKVIKDNKLAEELLPTTSGFFFGGTEYDKYYFDELKKTSKKLKALLKDKNVKDMDFYYNSSW